MLLYFVRHGETYNNIEAVFPLNNTELTEKGKKEALDTGRYLKRVKFDAIFSSPISRVQDTLKIMGFDKYATDPLLKDVETGDLAGRKITEVTAKDPEWYATFQDGVENRYNVEKFSSVKRRVVEFTSSIEANNYKNVLIATHLEPIRAMFSIATLTEGLPLTKLEIGNCSISIFSLNDKRIELKGFNWYPLENYKDSKNKSFN
jgi:broad specificity phosphatase PhoE